MERHWVTDLKLHFDLDLLTSKLVHQLYVTRVTYVNFGPSLSFRSWARSRHVTDSQPDRQTTIYNP